MHSVLFHVFKIGHLFQREEILLSVQRQFFFSVRVVEKLNALLHKYRLLSEETVLHSQTPGRFLESSKSCIACWKLRNN